MTASYSSAELESMMVDLESDLVERKESLAHTDKICRNICAFANDLPGHGRAGVVFVGVRDDGSCANLDITDKVLIRLAQLRDDGNILPLPSMVVQQRTLGGCTVAVVVVEPSPDTPVRHRGRAYVRVGPTVRLASPTDELQLSERRRDMDRSFDLRPVTSATLADIDLEHIQTQYLPQAVAEDVLEQNERSLEQQLRSLRLAENEHPTRGALLAFGNDPRIWLPGAYIQFLRIAGTEITDPISNQKTLSGQLDFVIRQLNDVLDANVSVGVDVKSGPREMRFPDFPLDALRQLAYNAVMHRSYENANTPVRLHWYSDRIEITSPGGLHGHMTPESFEAGDTGYRNPLVAEVMHHLGYAQRFGLGVPLARRALKENGNPEPAFDFQPTQFRVTVQARE